MLYLKNQLSDFRDCSKLDFLFPFSLSEWNNYLKDFFYFSNSDHKNQNLSRSEKHWSNIVREIFHICFFYELTKYSGLSLFVFLQQTVTIYSLHLVWNYEWNVRGFSPYIETFQMASFYGFAYYCPLLLKIRTREKKND